jgi:hypothetical protein
MRSPQLLADSPLVSFIDGEIARLQLTHCHFPEAYDMPAFLLQVLRYRGFTRTGHADNYKERIAFAIVILHS